MIRIAAVSLACSVIAGFAASVVTGLIRGSIAWQEAGWGTGLAVGFFAITALVLVIIERRSSAEALKLVLLAYLGKLGLLAVLAVGVTVPEGFDRFAFGIASSTSAVAFLVVETVMLSRWLSRKTGD
jgi:peptidoglycan/LPS O-acetylase OafA/YrhL